MVGRCRIEMLGGLRVHHAGRTVERFQTQKTGALLAYLALNLGKAQAREHLAELLWPDGDPTAVRNRLNQAISSLRRQLHLPEMEGAFILVADHHTLGVNPQLVATDVDEFLRAVRAAETAPARSEKLRALREAVALYRGEFLAGYYEDWALSHRLQFGDLYSRALESLVRMYSKSGEPDQAIEFQGKRLQHDPLDARMHVEMMDLYLRADRPSSALRQFEELGRLFRQSDEPIPAEAVQLRKRAEKDAKAAPATMLPKATAKPDSAPPATTLGVAAPTSRLPVVPNSFFGRESELAQLAEWLGSGARLITLLGVGGSGKTRLALEAAHRAAADFDGQAYFVAFGNRETADTFWLEVASAIQPNAGADGLELARLQGRCLLVLDNLEHLDVAEPIARLLAECPQAVVLATSRAPLQVEGERQLAIPPLALPELPGDGRLQPLAENETVALFVARAQAARPDFQLTERTAASIVGLCLRLEGLPLAIELAAGWARALTPNQMLEQVSERYDLLVSRRKDIPARHRTMRAALEGSFRLLEKDQQEGFVRLSLLDGGFSREDVLAVCPEDGLDELLSVLAERGMVVQEGVRYRMLETLQRFCDDFCSPALEAEVRWAIAERSLALARDPGILADWARELDGFYPNVLGSLRWLDAQGDRDRALELASRLGPYWETRGRIAEGRHALERLEPGPESPLALGALGRLTWLSGEYEAGAAQLEASLAKVEEEDGGPLALLPRYHLAVEFHRQGRFSDAARLLNVNLEAAQEVGDYASMASSWRAVGNARLEEGDNEGAREAYRSGLASAKLAADDDQVAASLTNLANLALLEGKLEAARSWLDEAVKRLQDVDHRWHGAMVHLIRARLARAEKDPEAMGRELLTAWRLAPHEAIVAWRVYLLIGVLFSDSGDAKAAAKALGFWDQIMAAQGRGVHRLELVAYEEARAKTLAALGRDAFSELEEVGRTLSPGDLIAQLEAFTARLAANA